MTAKYDWPPMHVGPSRLPRGCSTGESENEVESEKASFVCKKMLNFRGFCENYDFSTTIGS